ncbi:MAG: hypothetical protein JJU11_13735 [Candidatus Sumerlaeia bacterium]|nr:hypothetical protein [Candidatus Sumerlaeia bacterium]
MAESKETLPVTQKTQSVLRLSEREAGRLRHKEVRLVHLVLAMIRQGSCYACQLFRTWHVDLDKMVADLEELAGPRDQERIQEEIPFSSEVARFLIEVNDIRVKFANDWVGTDHFMLLLTANGEHEVSQVLSRHGIMECSVLRIIREQVPEPILASLPEADLVQALSRRGLLDVAESVINRDIHQPDEVMSVREACLRAGLDEAAFLEIMTGELGFPILRPTDTIDEQLISGFPGPYAQRHRIFPLRREEGRLLLVCDDPLRDDLRSIEEELSATIAWVAASKDYIDEILGRFYEI